MLPEHGAAASNSLYWEKNMLHRQRDEEPFPCSLSQCPRAGQVRETLSERNISSRQELPSFSAHPDNSSGRHRTVGGGVTGIRPRPAPAIAQVEMQVFLRQKRCENVTKYSSCERVLTSAASCRCRSSSSSSSSSRGDTLTSGCNGTEGTT
ncbi:uncharacterized protein V6R79_004335 [Siganus canaliculatus]